MDKLATFNFVMQRLDGRDKINTLIQEIGRLSALLLAENGSNPELATRLKALGDGMSRCRAADRFLNSTIPLRAFIAVAGSSDAIAIKVPRMLITLGYVVFFYYDNKIFLGLLGVLKDLDYADLGRKANRLWFFCLCLTILGQVMKLRKDQREQKGTDEETQLALYANCCDVLVAANGSGFLGGNEKVFRVLLIMSALIGIKKICLNRP